MANNTNNSVCSYDDVTKTKLASHLSSSYAFTPPDLHDTNDVCLCLSLSCRHCVVTTTHDQKKKTCNNDDAAAAVGKHNNLELIQPIHDSTVSDEKQSNKKDIMGRPKILRVYERRAKKTNT